MALTDAAAIDRLDPYRLPRHTAPSRYEVALTPDIGSASFAGRVSIDLVTVEQADFLVINSIELEIDECLLDGDSVPYQLEPTTERLVVTPSAGVVAGEHQLTISFRGILNDQLRGWYRSTYRDADGAQHVIATSQMQSTDCRRVFPCWDEPDFKAVFGITLVIEPAHLAVSNGPEIERIQRPDGRVAVRFADTMPMSSYLVAVVVGPLEATDWIDVDGIPMRIVHVPGNSHLTDFGLDVGAFCVRWFQRYYDIAYPSDKVDMLALPDFAAGAMENLGCITFRENLLLVDPATATQAERELVADVIAHELAHMWFGDLVTMEWWNGIWLNEAFATFMEVLACDAYAPEWDRWTAFGLERTAAFETDSLSSTRPVEFEVHSPADCEGMFDVLTYQKGGALLRMLEQYLGAERFREGVSHYLRTHSYGNTDTSDLWDAIEHTSGEPVRRIMDSWIWQPGYPLLSARLDGADLVLTQRRFCFDAESGSDSLWAIPVTVRVGDEHHRLLLDGDEARLRVGTDGTAPIVVNVGGHGFYRVEYSDTLRARFTPDTISTFATLERYNLVDDALSAVNAGAMSSVEFMQLAERFESERHPGVWQSIATGLRSVRRLIGEDQAALDGFQRSVRTLVGPAVAELGDPVEGEPDLVAKARGQLLGVMALQGGDPQAVRRARALYADWEHDPASVDAELAAVATVIVAATGGADDYERMLHQFRHGVTPQVQFRHLYALAEFDAPELMERTCVLAFSDEIKSQNAPFLMRAALANRTLGSQAWGYLRRHWTDANQRFPRNTISRMVEPVRLLDRPTDVADVQSFFSEHPIEQATKTLEQILERQRVNADVRRRNESDVRAHYA